MSESCFTKGTSVHQNVKYLLANDKTKVRSLRVLHARIYILKRDTVKSL